jgi:hypothetical protein
MKGLAALSALFLAACASGPTAPPQAPARSAKCAAAEYHQFDFWLGDWDVFELEDAKKPIARARVDAMVGGCAIREVYEQSDGLVGDSVNIYDGAGKAWHESWVTNRGQLLLIDGALQDSRMKLDGISHSADGTIRKVHHVWSIEPDGGVREAAEGSTDDGKTWKPLFDVVFRRHKE